MSDPSSVNTQPRVAVVQDGARRRYAVPRILADAGMLEGMYTDLFVRPGSKEAVLSKLIAKVKPRIGKMIGDRRNDLIPPEKVHQSAALTLRLRRAQRRFPITADYFVWYANEMDKWIRRQGLGNANVLFGFIRNLPPTLCEFARQRGLVTVGDQIIAPAAIEDEELRIQWQRFPHWASPDHVNDYPIIMGVERDTWKHLTHITCMSDYVSDGLRRQGVAAERISVIPYPFDVSAIPYAERLSAAGRPFRIGFIGAVGLRKGIPYLLEVAKRFQPSHVQFIVVGGSDVSDYAMQELRTHVSLVGKAPRSDLNRHLSQFDAFLFPSTCEGSAGSVMEAMASGLPVITSPNSGTLVRNGIDGFLTRYDDIDAMQLAIERLMASHELRITMGRSARTRVEQFNPTWYQQEISRLFQKLLVQKSANEPA